MEAASLCDLLMWYLVFLLVLGALAVLPTWLFWRSGRIATGLGAGACVLIGVLAPIVWLLGGMSEQPRNELGHPRRVHVRNDSESAVYLVHLVELDGGARADGVWVNEVAPGELTIIQGCCHPTYQDRACTDDPMAVVELRRSASLTVSETGVTTARPADLAIVAELEDCYPKGRNIVVWDGTTAFVDPDARPPLVDPEDEPLVYGLALAVGALALGITIDVVTRRVRRRRSQADAPWPPPTPTREV